MTQPYATEQRILAAISRGARAFAGELLRQYLALCTAFGVVALPLALLFAPGLLLPA